MSVDNRKIIKVAPVDDWFTITWELGNRCNYSCCYCPPEWHSLDGKLYSLEELQNIWVDIVNKTQHLGLKYKISFSGGEATIQKSFLPFLQWLRDNYSDQLAKILLTSNGSASLTYYLKTMQLIDNLSISIHSEYIDEKKFFEKIISLKQQLPADKFLHINIMNEPWNQERIKYYEQVLTEYDIYHSVNSVCVDPDNPLLPVLKGNFNFDISKPYKLQL